jgi:hypothetical protein
MPLLHCKKCHHEWEGESHSICDWCGAESFMLEEETPFEKLFKDKRKLAIMINRLIKAWTKMAEKP